MIQAHNLNLAFGSQKIFDSISFTIQGNQRIGLVGLNGSGKSTLLKTIAGQQPLEDGSISIAKNKTIAYMPQEVVLGSEQSILDETCSAFASLAKLQHKQSCLEETITRNPHDQEALEEYALVCEQLREYNLESLQAEAKKILMGLGFAQHQLDEPVATLSVGWKMRIVLAKLLLQKADFYLFDEPTNHLDIIAKDWFLHFLQNAPFGFMLVCHERYFLDKLCTEIFELERGNGTFYTGTYSNYENQKAHNRELLEAAYKTQQKEIQHKQEIIDRFRAKASKAKMAQSMIKALEKIEKIELPPTAKSISFHTPLAQQSGKIVLTVDKVSHSFGDKQIFHAVSCEVKRGQKIALIARNGVGKTTLLNIIARKLPLQKGSIEFGHNVQYALFDQDQTASLKPTLSIFDNIYQSTRNKTEQQIRSFLGAFLFSNDDIHKKVKVLSGGEKNRVGMVRVLLQDANLLLLDEPTNHLDIPSKEILLKALQEYQGTIIFVSHDHDFVNKLATDIIELTEHRAFYYEGNYDSYKEQKEYAQSVGNTHDTQKAIPTPSERRSASNDLALKKAVASLEKKINRLEQQIHELELSFAQLTYGTAAFEQAQQKLVSCKSEHTSLLQEWEAALTLGGE